MKEDLIYDLITEIGLGITPTGEIYDTDNGCPIICQGKTVKCSVSKNMPVFESANNFVFDPTGDFKIMKSFVEYYFEKKKYDQEDPKYIVSYSYEYKDKKSGLSRAIAVIQKPDGLNETVYSRYYLNKSLKFADIILRIGGGDDVDLSQYDDEPEEV